ncbi:MAG TPA: DUF1648 domain-containing protein [Acidobacteriaceae bacterium]|nr:DUF1648 domain-containing protein [Acidobacteriaceae bacterium]
MRKLLEAVALFVLLANLIFTLDALLGPHALPTRIPTHFNLAGEPTTWGNPRMLLLLPLISLALYVLMTMLSRRPASFNYPAPVTAQNRKRLHRLAIEMLAWLKAEVLTLFALIQFFAIRTVRVQQNVLPIWLMPVELLLVFATIFWYIRAMRRAAFR